MQKWARWGAMGLLLMGVLLAAIALVVSGRRPGPSPVDVTASQKSPTYQVVEVRAEIPAGAVLQAGDVHLRSVQEPPAGSYGQVQAVVGRTVQQRLSVGTVVIAEHLQSGLSGLLQLGERALAIKVDESTAVGHKLRPGDWVDVFVVLRRDNQEIGVTQARQLLARKRLLAYGDVQDRAVDPQTQTVQATAAPTPEAQRTAATARTAVLAVRVDEVNALLLAEQQGVVLLALRNPADDTLPLELPDAAERPDPSRGTTLAQVARATGARGVISSVPVAEVLPAVRPSTGTAALLAHPSEPQHIQTRRPVALHTVEFIKGTRKELVQY